MTKTKDSRKNNIIAMGNEGSVMLTVLIAFLFLSILVSIILSSTAVNFRMKAIDRNVKDEFYYAEKALNDIYIGLGADSSDIMGKAYNKVLTVNGEKLTFNDGRESNKVGYDSENETQTIKRFNEIYKTEIEKLVTKDNLSSYISNAAGRMAYLSSTPTLSYRYEDPNSHLLITSETLPDGFTFDRLKALVINDVVITSKNASNGFVSTISTDIIVQSPVIDFITVNKQGLDYAVVANNGIYFKGNTLIKGNVYGGSLTKTQITSDDIGGLVIENGDVNIRASYVVSGADIKVSGENATLNIANNGAESDIWFENLIVDSKSSTALDLEGSLYALDDFVINGEGSEVKIKGSYYGYNDGTFPVKNMDFVKELNNLSTTSASLKKSNSSALIVNSKNAKVDMKDLDTFVMLGKAYINHDSLSDTAVKNADSNKDIAINESVTVKANQQLYLVPAEFLDKSNPAVIQSTDSEGNVFSVSIPDTWFGKPFLVEDDPSDPNKKPYKTVIVKRGSTYFAYCYLNFKDGRDTDGKEFRDKYVEMIYPHTEKQAWNKWATKEERLYSPKNEGTSPTPLEMYERVSSVYELQGSEIYIGNDVKQNSDGSIDVTDENGKLIEGSVHIYSPNGIVQNSKILLNSHEFDSYDVVLKSNNKGIERFEDYSQNMFNKYRWMDTYLDAQEEHSLTNMNKGSAVNYNWNFYSVPDGEGDTVDDFNNAGLPLSRIVWINDSDGEGIQGINGTIRDPDGEFPDCDVIISNRADHKYVLTESLKGFLIVDGDVTVKNGVNVEGFIYATGKVTFEGNNEIKFNSTLFERRISDEIKLVKQEFKSNKNATAATAYKNYYLISYLLNIKANTTGISGRCDNPSRTDLMYNYGKGDGANAVAEINTDYRNYIMFENWKNGQIQD